MSIINDIIETFGAEKLNSLTKYPSILTYHDLGERGSLLESLVEGKDYSGFDQCFITEKIDGTNARIIFDGKDYIIGSREELLYARGDRFGNPQLNIVNTIKPIAEKHMKLDGAPLWIMFGEVYGGNVTSSSKQYTADRTFGFRLFDVAQVALDILYEPIEKISSWREHGGQQFMDVNTILLFAEKYGVKSVPYREVVPGNDIPKDRIAMLKFLQKFATTQAGINAQGRAEGIVVRDFHRNLIRKMRFEDYERTAKREKWAL